MIVEFTLKASAFKVRVFEFTFFTTIYTVFLSRDQLLFRLTNLARNAVVKCIPVCIIIKGMFSLP